MNILVVNDDGIESQGIKALVESLASVADVFVCAPDGQRSAKSQAITIRETVYVREVEYPGAKGALITSGTPADCTKIGLQFFEEEGNKIDMVYTGINMGSNLGLDTLYSGTVGAAMEAAITGVQAVAVSVDSHEATHYDLAQQLAVDVIGKVYGVLTPSTIININVPDLPREEVKGIRYTTLFGERYYNDSFKSVDESSEAGSGYQLSGEPAEFTTSTDDYDLPLSVQGWATITPLKYDYTDYEMMNAIKGWNLNI